jgi:hypothetical protein
MRHRRMVSGCGRGAARRRGRPGRRSRCVVRPSRRRVRHYVEELYALPPDQKRRAIALLDEVLARLLDHCPAQEGPSFGGRGVRRR